MNSRAWMSRLGEEKIRELEIRELAREMHNSYWCGNKEYNDSCRGTKSSWRRRARKLKNELGIPIKG